MAGTAPSESARRPRRPRRQLRRTLAAASILGAGLLATGLATDANGVNKVTICHATGSSSNPYVIITVAPAAASGGHAHHGDDIIPAFTHKQGQQTIHFAGHNLGPVGPASQTGYAILQNGCRVPTANPSTGAGVVTTATTPATVAQTAVPIPTPTAVPGQVPTPIPTPAPTAVPGQTPSPTNAPGQVPTPIPTPAPTAVPGQTPSPTNAPGQVPTPTPTAAPAAVPQLVPATIAGETAPPLRTDTRLVPIADCAYLRPDGVTEVWFDYSLTGEQAVRVEWGPGNQLSPDGRPPRLFGPGLHRRVMSVETLGESASWTLFGTTAQSGPDTPDCDLLTNGGTSTSTPGGPDTTDPDTTDATNTTEPDTTEPPTTTPNGCEVGERKDGDDCVPVETVQLSVVDNTLDCDGHGVVVFAAINANEFELEGDGFTSELSPPRFDGAQPEKISVRTVSTSNGFEVSETFVVRYITAVTWTVTHDGISSSISAGTDGARINPDCPLARIETSGLNGTLPPGSAPGLAVTGSSLTLPLAIGALLASLLGAALIMTARRPRIDPVDVH
jgi:hypothetical protein